MTGLDISKLKQIFSVLNNEKRIISEFCSEKEYTVTQISKKIELDYSATIEYISILSKACRNFIS
jgi:predicted transcriptional regulator